MLLLRHALTAGCVAALAVGAVACSSNDEEGVRTLVIRQEDPILQGVDLTQTGATVGDLLFFEAVITDEAGTVGELLGSLATAQLPSPNSQTIEERLGNLVFSFGDDTLVVIGATEYPSDQSEMRASLPQVRAVVGGTGRFLGAGGEVTSERMDDGTYTHTFTLVDIAED